MLNACFVSPWDKEWIHAIALGLNFNDIAISQKLFNINRKGRVLVLVAAIEKHHEERYRALLHNVEMAEVFAKSEVKVWECRNCGHIVVGEKAPEVCPTCNHPQSYFEIHAENY